MALSKGPKVNVNTEEVNAFTSEWVAGTIDDGIYCVALKGVEHEGASLIIATCPSQIFTDYLVMIQDIALGMSGKTTIPLDREVFACMHHYQYCMERKTCNGLADVEQSDYDYADNLIEMWELYRDAITAVQEPGEVEMQPMAHGEHSLQSPWPRAERDSNL